MASYLGTSGTNPGDVCTLGKLGVGTSSPGATLDVVGNLKVGGIQIADSSGYLKPKTSTAAGAPSNSIYIDTTSGILYFKDGNSATHALY
jgi:hypothetical protein